MCFVTLLKSIDKHFTFDLCFNCTPEHKVMINNFWNILSLVIFNTFQRYELGIWIGFIEITILWKIYPTTWKMNQAFAKTGKKGIMPKSFYVFALFVICIELSNFCNHDNFLEVRLSHNIILFIATVVFWNTINLRIVQERFGFQYIFELGRQSE